MGVIETAYATIESIKSAENDAAVLNELRDVSEKAGFDYFIVSGLPHRGIELEPFVLVSDWPEEWFKRYMSRAYVEIDPIARNCFATTEPFAWNEVAIDEDSRSVAQKFMGEASEFGLSAGLCVPVHTEDAMQGCVSFGGTGFDTDPKIKMILHMVSLYAHGRLRLLRRKPWLGDVSTLTQRECEVIEWASSGKTSQDIADILGISKRTVDFHFVNAGRKMGTATRIHTVAEAVRYRMVSCN